MVRQTTSITTDSELLEKAREMGINVSESATDGIREALGIQEVQIQRQQDKKNGNLLGESCHLCKKLYPYATKQDYKHGRNAVNKLVWLYPDCKWICTNCLTKISSVL